MVTIKSKLEIEKMRRAGKIVYETLSLIKQHTKPGVTTLELDALAEKYIRKCGAIPSFKGYNGFPKSVCISVNEEVIHGIPSKRVLLDGDIISVDVGACVDGYHGDAARTFAVGNISREAKKLISVTRQSFFDALLFMKEGHRVSDISAAVQNCVEENGFSVVRAYCGHGIGKDLHEAPEVPNYVRDDGSNPAKNVSRGTRLYAGMTLAVEPMVNMGTSEIYVKPDKWTVVTKDGKLSAHYENTVLITKNEPIVLTRG
ncbi:MAG: type I methionyl aminopeptidase [Oscillospiraceae bacterium]|nr:type I methionyl aminopeptidase [Oscillospiraceae bacterium]